VENFILLFLVLRNVQVFLCAEEHFSTVRSMSVSVLLQYARIYRRTLSLASLVCCWMMQLEHLFRWMCWSTLVYLLR